MLLLDYRGGTKFQRDTAEKVVGWFLKKMLPRYRKISLTIRFTKCYTTSGAYGYCWEGDEPREYEIELDKNMRLFDMVGTLCHELVHLKQYVKGEMKQIDGHRTRWKKKIVPAKTDYVDQPWEKEAFRLEKKLALQVFEEVL